jgi:hypothetical protein
VNSIVTLLASERNCGEQAMLHIGNAQFSALSDRATMAPIIVALNADSLLPVS